ncbi:MAG: CcmD family protein [Bacteroidota bacterium]
MADALMASGKIYIVVIVVAVIFAGITAFMIHLDKRLRKIEQNKV